MNVVAIEVYIAASWLISVSLNIRMFKYKKMSHHLLTHSIVLQVKGHSIRLGGALSFIKFARSTRNVYSINKYISIPCSEMNMNSAGILAMHPIGPIHSSFATQFNQLTAFVHFEVESVTAAVIIARSKTSSRS